MTSKQIRQLSLKLYTVAFECDGVPKFAIWQRCLHTCRRWDLEPSTVLLISEALTGYLYDKSRPQTPLVTPLAKAQAVLHQTAGAAYDGETSPYPAWTRLTPSAIAAMIEWALTMEDAPGSAGLDAAGGVTREGLAHAP
jgi:hypothetical protein